MLSVFFLLLEGGLDGGMDTDLEGVVEDEYDYAVSCLCEARCESERWKVWRVTHGVTSTSFPTRKGSRMQRRGSLSLSCGRPICAVSAQNTKVEGKNHLLKRFPSLEENALLEWGLTGRVRTHRGVLNRLVIPINPSPWECGVTSI